jgi:hypothetical protein
MLKFHTMKKEEAGSPETLVPTYLTIRFHITVSSSLRIRWLQMSFNDIVSPAK